MPERLSQLPLQDRTAQSTCAMGRIIQTGTGAAEWRTYETSISVIARIIIICCHLFKKHYTRYKRIHSGNKASVQLEMYVHLWSNVQTVSINKVQSCDCKTQGGGEGASISCEVCWGRMFWVHVTLWCSTCATLFLIGALNVSLFIFLNFSFFLLLFRPSFSLSLFFSCLNLCTDQSF